MDNSTNTISDGINELLISFNKDEPFISSPINSFSTSKATKQTLLYNISKDLNIYNTAFTNYTKDASNWYPFNPLSKRFCDNIIVYYYLLEDVVDNPVVAKLMCKNKQKEEEETEEENGKTTEVLSKYLPENTAHLVRILNNLIINVNKTFIKPTRPKVKDGRAIQLLKVSLTDVSLDNVLKLVADNSCKEQLETNNFYINDINITQDFAKCINKKEAI